MSWQKFRKKTKSLCPSTLLEGAEMGQGKVALPHNQTEPQSPAWEGTLTAIHFRHRRAKQGTREQQTKAVSILHQMDH